MADVRINWEQIKRSVAKDLSKKQRKAADQRVGEIFEDAVQGMQNEFESHPVTTEIEGGIDSDNESGTLIGGTAGAPKNLFSFIGFKRGSNPIAALRAMLAPKTKTGPQLKFERKGDETPTTFYYRYRGPDLGAIYDKTPMPWGEGSLSWVKSVETHIPGFAQFLSKFLSWPPSRSGGGIQVKKDIRSSSFTKPKEGYLSVIAANFMDRMKRKRKDSRLG